MNALVWWLGASLTGTSGAFTAWTVTGLWLFACATWTAWSWRRWGPTAAPWMLALMLVNPWFRDLPTWRSWTTSCGELAFLGACLLAMEAKRPTVAVVAAISAAWFKEPAAITLAAAALLIYQKPWVAAAAGLSGAAGIIRFALAPHGPPLTPSPLNQMLVYVTAIGSAGWPAALAAGSLSPLASLVAFSTLVMPAIAGTLALLAAVALAVRSRSKWAVVILSALILPAIYQTQNGIYLVDASSLVTALAAGSLARGNMSIWVLLVALVLGARTLPASFENARWQASRWTVVESAWQHIEEHPPQAIYVSPVADGEARYLALRCWARWDPASMAGPSGFQALPGLWVSVFRNDGSAPLSSP